MQACPSSETMSPQRTLTQPPQSAETAETAFLSYADLRAWASDQDSVGHGRSNTIEIGDSSAPAATVSMLATLHEAGQVDHESVVVTLGAQGAVLALWNREGKPYLFLKLVAIDERARVPSRPGIGRYLRESFARFRKEWNNGLLLRPEVAALRRAMYTTAERFLKIPRCSYYIDIIPL